MQILVKFDKIFQMDTDKKIIILMKNQKDIVIRF